MGQALAIFSPKGFKHHYRNGGSTGLSDTSLEDVNHHLNNFNYEMLNNVKTIPRKPSSGNTGFFISNLKKIASGTGSASNPIRRRDKNIVRFTNKVVGEFPAKIQNMSLLVNTKDTNQTSYNNHHHLHHQINPFATTQKHISNDKTTNINNKIDHHSSNIIHNKVEILHEVPRGSLYRSNHQNEKENDDDILFPNKYLNIGYDDSNSRSNNTINNNVLKSSKSTSTGNLQEYIAQGTLMPTSKKKDGINQHQTNDKGGCNNNHITDKTQCKINRCYAVPFATNNIVQNTTHQSKIHQRNNHQFRKSIPTVMDTSINSNNNKRMNNSTSSDDTSSTIITENSTSVAKPPPRRTVLQASTSELLKCLGNYLVMIYPNVVNLDADDCGLWLRGVDRALLVQGWQDLAFINPANVVFLYLLVKETIILYSVESYHDIKSHVLMCLYLSYAYCGHEISYPLKPFLIENDRDKFWKRMTIIMSKMSRQMLKIHSDPAFFTQIFAELKSYN